MGEGQRLTGARERNTGQSGRENERETDRKREGGRIDQSSSHKANS